jgi:hypothetical protein
VADPATDSSEPKAEHQARARAQPAWAKIVASSVLSISVLGSIIRHGRIHVPAKTGKTPLAHDLAQT